MKQTKEWAKAVRIIRSMGINNSEVWAIVRRWYDDAQNHSDINAGLIIRRFFAVMNMLALEKWEDSLTATKTKEEKHDNIT